MHGSPSHGGGPQQCQEQLNKISDHHGPQPPGHGVRQHQGSHDAQQQQRVGDPSGGGHRLVGDDAKSLHHFAHGQEGVTDADAVDRQCQQKGFDASEPGRCRPPVTQFGESGIGEHATTAPERCEHHGHCHMGQAEPPPLPVGREASSADDARHIERRIDGKGCGRHRGTREPAAEAATRHEVVILTTVASGQPETKGQRRRQIANQDDPVDRGHKTGQMAAVSLTSGESAAADRKQHPDPDRGWPAGSQRCRDALAPA